MIREELYSWVQKKYEEYTIGPNYHKTKALVMPVCMSSFERSDIVFAANGFRKKGHKVVISWGSYYTHITVFKPDSNTAV